MNTTAERLGMRGTKFKNPSGWHNPEQYTTAYDMSKTYPGSVESVSPIPEPVKSSLLYVW